MSFCLCFFSANVDNTIMDFDVKIIVRFLINFFYFRTLTNFLKSKDYGRNDAKLNQLNALNLLFGFIAFLCV